MDYGPMSIIAAPLHKLGKVGMFKLKLAVVVSALIIATSNVALAESVKLLCENKTNVPGFGFGSDIIDSPAVVQFDEQQRSISVEIPSRHPDYSKCRCSGGRTYPGIYHSNSATFTPDKITFEAPNEGLPSGASTEYKKHGVILNRLTGELTFDITPDYPGQTLICHAAKAQF